MRYRARAPLRIDFAGGWTDVPLYAEAEGGAVVNAAITRYVEGSIARPEAHQGLIRTLRGDRSYVSYALDLPTGAGLGASAAQTVLWVTLVKASIANVWNRLEIAEMACGVSTALGVLGGKQDEYASALGGIQFLAFDSGVLTESLSLPPRLLEELRDRLVLVYSGQRRLSPEIHTHVWQRYQSGDPATVVALGNLRRIAQEMRGALLADDLWSVGALMTENWVNQKALHPSVSNPQLDQIFDLAGRSGAAGGKACGAGGGGCLIFLSEPGREYELRAAFEQQGLRVIDFAFDTYGVYLTKG